MVGGRSEVSTADKNAGFDTNDMIPNGIDDPEFAKK